MGAKLFAWAGGLAMFLGIVFFVKLSLERGWISDEVRIFIGLLVGAGLVIGGVWAHRKPRFVVLGQTLCATGIVALYGVSFAAHQLTPVWPFEHVGVTFAFMAGVTALAFLLAVRMEARVVAILGLLGGFLTPILCSSGVDRPLALFSYIALLDIGLLAVVKRTRWPHLSEMAAAGTLLMQVGWMLKFFESSHYAAGLATWVPISVLLGFAALFVAAQWSEKANDSPPTGALVLCGGAMLSAFAFLTHDTIGSRPGVLYTLVFVINLLVMAMVWRKPKIQAAQGIAAGISFLHLWIWTQQHLQMDLLGWALGLYLVFGVVHTLYAALWQRRDPDARSMLEWTPVITVLMMILPVACLPEVSMLLWPVLLLADLVVIGVAIVTGAFIPVVAALVLTLITIGSWLFFRLPANGPETLLPFLAVLGGFSIVFNASGYFVSRKQPDAQVPLLPVSAAVMPFLLLIVATLRLHVANPTPIFALAAVLTALLLTLVRLTRITRLAPVALGCVLAVEFAWHAQMFRSEHAMVALSWYLGFYALFTVFPRLFAKSFETRCGPWLASAAVGLGTYGLVYHTVKTAWPDFSLGMLTLLFAIAPLVTLGWIMKHHGAANPGRQVQAGSLFGVALFFVTLFFAVQFDRQLITLGWALEGATLLGLGFCARRRILRHAGLGVVALAFVRLFFWDLANSDSVYRIAALIGTAIVALGVSWLYQRFRSEEDKS